MRDLPLRLARLAGELRVHEVGTSLKDELDAAEAVMLVDWADRDELFRTLRIALKIAPSGFAIFDRLFAEFVREKDGGTPSKPPSQRAPDDALLRKAAPAPRGKILRWDPDTRQLTDADGSPDPDGEQPGYSPDRLLRRKRFDDIHRTDRDLAAMERLVLRLGRRLATRRSRRLCPTRGRGVPDLRASLRRSLRTFGEMVTFSRRRRPIEKPRLVFLCDTSGSMDAYARFLLLFVLSLGRAPPRAEVFAFNTELVRLTATLSCGDARRILQRIVDVVPDWSGGTRLGDSLAAFADHHLLRCVDAKTIVVILSDGLDRGDPEKLALAMRTIHQRAKKVIWLNPLLGDPGYEPKARGMSAALPFVDKLAPAHDIDSLERLLPHLTG
jgi:uncharacterized protein with von Willebrand factor type A (vWA) domain